jgi:anthranilate phosphoribosyltransferase
VSLSARTHVREVQNGRATSLVWTHEDFGLASCSSGDLCADGSEESAARIREILTGRQSPSATVVLANTAAALFAANQVTTLRDGVAAAANAISSGRAQRVLEQLIACSLAKQQSS